MGRVEMPLQNRVLATGEIVADPARGLFMGNRGILHDDARRLGRPRWKHKAWIICTLVYKSSHRRVMTPGQYTELFFLDEAVALAAGHRPCKLCRRSAYAAYTQAAGHDAPAPRLDERLHSERAVPRLFKQRRHRVDISGLPDGAICLIEDAPHLVRGTAIQPVMPAGYGEPRPRPPEGVVEALTPPTSLTALANGYPVHLHPTALTG